MNRTRAALLAILALAAATRLVGFTGLVIGDDVVYSEMAVRTLESGLRVDNVHAARLGFLLPICASYAAFGPGEVALVLPNLLCSMGTVLLGFLIGRRLFSDAAGLAAAAILAVHPLLISYATEGHTDPALAFWTALAMYVYLRAERPASLAMVGFLLGMAYLTKEAAIALVPFFIGHAIATKRRWAHVLPLALAAVAVVAAECFFYAVTHGNAFHRYALIRSQHTGFYMAAQYPDAGSILFRMSVELPGRLFIPTAHVYAHVLIHLAALGAAIALRRDPGVRFLGGWFLSIFGIYALLPSSLRPFLPGFLLHEWTLQVFALPLACILGAAVARRRWAMVAIVLLALFGNVVRVPNFRRFAAGPREAYAHVQNEPIVTADSKTIEAFIFFDGHHPKREYRSYETDAPRGVLVVDRFWTEQGRWWSRPPPPAAGPPFYASERVTITRIPPTTAARARNQAMITFALVGWLAVQDLQEARRFYPPDVTRAVLTGRRPAPAGFDAALEQAIGKERLTALRAGTDPVGGRDNDEAALCLLRLKAKVEDGPAPGRPNEGPITVTKLNSTYRTAPGKTSGFFRTGQPADLLLSGIDFNNSGGPLLFNHPMGIAGDGTRLFLADTYNNRVLVWNTPLASNVPPDFVLGQKDFTSNDSGTGPDRMNWPAAVATDGKRLVVADTDNHRLLIWNRLPEKSGQPADLILQGSKPGEGLRQAKDGFQWPWGVWTGGDKLVVSSTRGGSVLIWNRFPTREGQPADLLLTGGGKLGTPRTITSDGTSLIVGDHNPKTGAKGGGSFFWKKAPLDGELPDLTWRGSIGSVRLDHARGVCLTDDYFFLSDLDAGKIHVWKGIPGPRDEPAFSLEARGAAKLSTDGEWLAVATMDRQRVLLYRIKELGPEARPVDVVGRFNMPSAAHVSHGHLFVADNSNNRVFVWRDVKDAAGGKTADVVLGQSAPGDTTPATARDRMHFPFSVCFDGAYLWVGEVKFSERLLRFSPSE